MKASSGGIYGGLRDATGIVAQAKFVPVASSAGTGVASGAGAAAGTAAAGGAAAGAITVAAPLVLMAVAVGISANAEAQRDRAIEHITELLESLHEQKLEDERTELSGCSGAIRKATAVLLDRGKVGLSLGLDSAVHAIDMSLSRTAERLDSWQKALARLPENGCVELSQLGAFPGIAGDGGQFRAYLEIAALAIALKRRVIVLQAVEHAQSEEGNVFQNFTRELKADQERIDQLEADINQVIERLASLQLGRKKGLRSAVVPGADVDRLLRQAFQIRGLAELVAPTHGPSDVAVEIAARRDGSLVVFPAAAV